jgi:hypothetical protein
VNSNYVGHMGQVRYSQLNTRYTTSAENGLEVLAFTVYSLYLKILFVLSLDFNVYIQIDSDEYRHIYKSHTSSNTSSNV